MDEALDAYAELLDQKPSDAIATEAAKQRVAELSNAGKEKIRIQDADSLEGLGSSLVSDRGDLPVGSEVVGAAQEIASKHAQALEQEHSTDGDLERRYETAKRIAQLAQEIIDTEVSIQATADELVPEGAEKYPTDIANIINEVRRVMSGDFAYTHQLLKLSPPPARPDTENFTPDENVPEMAEIKNYRNYLKLPFDDLHAAWKYLSPVRDRLAGKLVELKQLEKKSPA